MRKTDFMHMLGFFFTKIFRFCFSAMLVSFLVGTGKVVKQVIMDQLQQRSYR